MKIRTQLYTSNKNTFNFLLFCCLILGTTFNMQAQNQLSGTVYFQNGDPIDGAVINLLETDSSTFINYTTTDEKGQWSIDAPQVDSFIIEFSRFGYGSEFRLITDPVQYAQPFEVRLEEKGFNLDEVTVKEKAIGVKQVDDTLTFNLGYFTTGAERTLGDVIKRLPGMEIRDGAVYYGGEQITKMLVQGRDIINNNQQLATQGIRADQLKNIKIIENYKEKSQQFQSQQSEDVAMDVRLKDSEINQWSGEAELLGGYPESVRGNVNAFNLSDKVGISAFVRANNVGEEVLDWDDIQGMLDMNQVGYRSFRVSGSAFSALMPSGLQISDQVQSNRDGIINANLDLKINDEISVKGFAIAAYAERESEVFNRIEYLSEGISRTSENTKYSETPIYSTVWKMDYQLDSLTFLSATLPLSYNNATSDYTNIGQYGEKDFNTVRNSDEWNYLVLPNIRMRRKVGKEGQWRFDAKYDATKLSGSNLFRDDFEFLGVPVSGDSSFYRIMQDQVRFNEQFSVSSDVKLVWGDWFIRPSAEYSYIHNLLQYNADQDAALDFGTDAELNQHSAVAGLSGGYETSDWEIIPTLTMNYYDRTFAQAGSHEEFFPGYDLRISRIFNRAHRLSLSGSYGLSYPSFDNVKNTYDIASATQVSTGGYPIDLAQKSYNTNLRYRNYNVQSELYMFGSVSYSYSDDAMSGFSQEFGDYILNGMTPIPYTESFNSRIYTGKEFGFFPFRVGGRLSYRWSEGFSARGSGADEQFLTQNNSYSGEIDFDSRWEFPLNIELEFEYSYNTSESLGGINDFSSYSPELELEYQAGGYRFETELNYNYSIGNNESSEIYTWDIETSYEFNSFPLTLRVEANNILNLEPEERLVSNFGNNINSFTRYRVFPGYIIAGASWKF